MAFVVSVVPFGPPTALRQCSGMGSGGPGSQCLLPRLGQTISMRMDPEVAVLLGGSYHESLVTQWRRDEGVSG